MDYTLFQGFDLGVDYQYLSVDKVATLNPTAVEQDVFAVSAPRHSATVEIDYLLGEFEFADVVVELDYISQSRSNVSAFAEDGSSRDIFNARLQFNNIELEDDSGRVAIGVWARNLNDDEYVVSGRQIAGANPERAFGQPRSYGIDLVWKYR